MNPFHVVLQFSQNQPLVKEGAVVEIVNDLQILC
jgi:hypothetical protein